MSITDIFKSHLSFFLVLDIPFLVSFWTRAPQNMFRTKMMPNDFSFEYADRVNRLVAHRRF